ncbi:hypothetical protein ACHAWF_004678, partial [Thalassiosira exigua]
KKVSIASDHIHPPSASIHPSSLSLHLHLHHLGLHLGLHSPPPPRLARVAPVSGAAPPAPCPLPAAGVAARAAWDMDGPDDDGVEGSSSGGDDGGLGGGLSGGSSDSDRSLGSANDDDDDEGDEGSASPPLEYRYEYLPPPDDELVAGHRSLTEDEHARIERVDAAATGVLAVLEKYGSAPLPPLPSDPGDGAADADGWDVDPDGPWADPREAMREIVDARENLVRAWEDDAPAGRQSDDGQRSNEQGQGADTEKPEWWRSVLAKAKVSAKPDESQQPGSRGTNSNIESKVEPLTREEEARFQEVHMEWATSAFSEELEALRDGTLEELTSARRRAKGAAARPSDDLGLDPTLHSFVAPRHTGGASAKTTGEAAEDVDVRVLADALRSGGAFLSATEKRMLLGARTRARTIGGAGAEEGLSLHERRRRNLGLAVGERT